MVRVMGRRAHPPQSRPERRLERSGRLAAAVTVVALLAVGALVFMGGSIGQVATHDHSTTIASVARTRVPVAPVGHVPVPLAVAAAGLAIGLVFLGLTRTSSTGRRVVLRPAELGSRSPPRARR